MDHPVENKRKYIYFRINVNWVSCAFSGYAETTPRRVMPDGQPGTDIPIQGYSFGPTHGVGCLSSGCSTVCLVLLGQVGNWQNCQSGLCNIVEYPNLSQPNPTHVCLGLSDPSENF